MIISNRAICQFFNKQNQAAMRKYLLIITTFLITLFISAKIFPYLAVVLNCQLWFIYAVFTIFSYILLTSCLIYLIRLVPLKRGWKILLGVLSIIPFYFQIIPAIVISLKNRYFQQWFFVALFYSIAIVNLINQYKTVKFWNYDCKAYESTKLVDLSPTEMEDFLHGRDRDMEKEIDEITGKMAEYNATYELYQRKYEDLQNRGFNAHSSDLIYTKQKELEEYLIRFIPQKEQLEKSLEKRDDMYAVIKQADALRKSAYFIDHDYRILEEWCARNLRINDNRSSSSDDTPHPINPNPNSEPGPIPTNPVYRECMTCSGSGQCIVCNGAGSNYEIGCQHCYGTGNCPACYGQGKVLVGFE